MSRCRSTRLSCCRHCLAIWPSVKCKTSTLFRFQLSRVRDPVFSLAWPSTRFVVDKIIQDNHGFLWLSAADGLRRYDGYGFMRVPDSEAPRSTGFIICESLMKDRSGRIWFGA